MQKVPSLMIPITLFFQFFSLSLEYFITKWKKRHFFRIFASLFDLYLIFKFILK